MSLPNRRSVLRLGLTAGLASGLAACFKPLYGPTASGQNLSSVLASIDVEKMMMPLDLEELGHELRSELVYQLNGSGIPAPKRYKLKLNYNQRLSNPIIDAETGRATTASVTGAVDYTLLDSDGKTVVTKGRVDALVTYERPAQRFASLRARRDANRRLGKELAGHIKNRLAMALSAR
jgi:Predicted secreted (periplasmic) protein